MTRHSAAEAIPTPNRIQTTIHADSGALETLTRLSESSGVSRSKLIDLAIRRFARWASSLDVSELKLIAKYEFDEEPSSRPPPKEKASGEHNLGIELSKDHGKLTKLARDLIASLEHVRQKE